MNRANLGHEVPSSSSAAFPTSSTYSFSASTNQAAATGVSRTRFPKQKRHSATARARPVATVQDGGAGQGFKPSRLEVAEGDTGDVAEARETTSLREQLYGWKPFVPDTSMYRRSSSDFLSGVSTSGLNVSSCSNGPGLGPGMGSGSIQAHAFSFGSSLSGNTSPGLFIFGSGMDKDISSLRGTSSQNSSAENLGCAESVKSEGPEYTCCMDAFLDSSKSVETGIMFGQSNCSVGVNNELSGLDAFLCEANAKQQGNLPQKSLMESNTVPSNELKSQIPIFGNRKEMKCPYSNNNSFNSLEDLLVKQNDRTMKMHHEDTSSGNIKKKEKIHSHENIVKAKFSYGGSSLSMLHDDMRNLKIEKSVTKEYDNKDSNVFEFGSGIKKNTFISNSLSHVDVSYCKLLEDMYKLHSENSADEFQCNTHSNIFVFGSGLKDDAPFIPTTAIGLDDADISNLPESIEKMNIHSSANEEHRNDNRCAFVFNSGVNESDSSAKLASLNPDDRYVCELPDEMGKMKLNGCSSESKSLKTMKGDSWHKHDQNLHLAFAGITSITTSVDSSVEEIEEKVKELKVDCGEAFPDICNGSDNVKSGDFALRSTANVSFSSAETFNMPSMVIHKMSSKHEDEMLEFGFDVNEHNKFFEKMRAPNVGRKEGIVDDTSSGYSSENTVNVAHSDIKRGDLTSLMGQSGPPERTALNAYGSSGCDLQSEDDSVSNLKPLQAEDSCELGGETSSFPSLIPTFQSSRVDTNSASLHTALETPGMEFISQKHGMPMFTKENLSTKSHMNMTFGTKTGDSKGVRLKKKRAKSRRPTPVQLGTPKQFVPVDMVPEENLEDTISGYSPMDFSPYEEILASKQDDTIEASGASIESIPFDLRQRFTDTQNSTSIGGKDETVSEAEHFDTCCLGKHTGAEAYGSRVTSTGQFTSDSSLIDEFGSGQRKVNLTAKDEYVSQHITRISSVNSGSLKFGPNIKQTTGEDGSGITFAADDQFNFQFAASSSNQDPLLATHYRTRRKSKVKVGQDSRTNCAMVPTASPLSNLFVFSKTHVATEAEQEQKRSDEKREGKINNEAKPNEGLTATAACFAAREACEKWRLRGNEAYAVGNLSKAEEYYNEGINSISLQNVSDICSRALMLCYSNRAATRMCLGRLREAIDDCKMALAIDPCFLRAQLRAGNIHLSLGEAGDALQHFKKCLELNCEADSDKKLLLEAANGVEKAQRLNDLIDQSSAFLIKRTHCDGAKILEIVSEALSICPHSESMLELKAEALLMLQNYDEAIEICEQTIELAEKNAFVAEADCQIKDHNYSGFMERSYVRLWRWHIISKSYFYLGKLHEADELLQKCEKVKPVTEKFSESLISFAVNLRELLHLKTAGNEAFQAGRHLEAVDFYSSALALNTESRPFTAICLCNRAAAYQALGQITDAIADCSLAIALDSCYRKAISRRATLHEMIRDYDQAAADLRMLISLLEKSNDNCNTSATLQRSTSNTNDLQQAYCRLSMCEEEARKGVTFDMYMILGIERSSSVAEVKKAYRKAALRHHPDKAGQLLGRSDSNDDRVWKEIAKEVYNDTDRLFKMIVEAYTTLSDPSKRLAYDAEEELRTTKKGYTESSSNRTTANSYHSQSKQNVEQRHWRSYGSGSSHRQCGLQGSRKQFIQIVLYSSAEDLSGLPRILVLKALIDVRLGFRG
ncbi:hypothetical protein HPP92_002847 [Vanilla planifolia]|uniref:J domain-containing protein n=1 Tax=Vanilla planifolia TaxID=51239 RepID=A0A835S1Y0_VANPL|nr:hypothetical protein HPP92_002847 [Vanilla planifolia]